jgi:hypothetical protein
MANTTISPNMNLPVPVPGVDPGPDWATNVNACFQGIDQHSHIPGQGVPVTPAGLNISSDLSFGSNNATQLRSTRYVSQTAAIAGAQDLACSFVLNGDLYYIDSSSNLIRITQGGSVTGATGTITGLPSGTASASYSAGTFTFQSATNTGATGSFGPVAIGSTTPSTKQVTLSANPTQAANYGLILPTVQGGVRSVMMNDGSGNLSFVSSTGTGSVVLSSSPTISSPILTGTISTGLTANQFVGTDGSSNLTTVSTPSIVLATDGSGNAAGIVYRGTGSILQADKTFAVTITSGVVSFDFGNPGYDATKYIWTANVVNPNGNTIVSLCVIATPTDLQVRINQSFSSGSWTLVVVGSKYLP